MVSKKVQVWLPLLFSIVLTVGMWLGYKLREDTGGAAAFLGNTRSSALQEILSLISNNYVDKVATDSLNEATISELLSHLDPHSQYIPARELQEVNDDLQGNFQGIGVEFQIFDDTVNIVNVIADGPSFKAGVQVGDKIIAVNDTALVAGKKITPDKIKQLLRGPGGTTVKVAMLRGSEMKNLQIERGLIPVPSVDAAYMISPGTGFIHINKFAETTYEEFMKSLETLQQQGMKSLILDLRGNGGGVLTEAADIADEFLDGDKMIVYTQGNVSPRREYRCKREGLFETGKLTVLVDESSASASEILSGALQDWDRADIIGRRTFGKGLVQQQFPLSDGSAVRLTVARYYTPVGRNIQKPYDKGIDDYEGELMSRFHNGEVVNGDTTNHKGQAFKTPGGHTVYGGGGITPDIFIPFDTTTLPKGVEQVYTKRTIDNFVYHYFLDHKTQLLSYTSPSEFYRQFKPGEAEWQQLAAQARKDTIDLGTVPPAVKEDLLEQFQLSLARQIWRSNGFYEVRNQTDPMVKKALELLK